MVSSDSAGPKEPKAGECVGDRYELIEELGRGAMGSVWRAHDRALDVPCALKFMLDEHSRTSDLRERFNREARVAARLRSPHTVRVTDVSEWEGRPYLVMELLHGEDLETLLQREGTLSPELTAEIIEQVARGLQCAHEASLVHRDLKPENIFMQEGPTVHAKVLDFGVAKKLDATSGVRTAMGTLIGTPQYMSPEQANGDSALDFRSDLWSLAVVAYRCLKGRTPFEGDSLGALLVAIITADIPPLADEQNGLPAALNSVWFKAANRNREMRHGSALELASAFRTALTQRGAAIPQTATLEQTPNHTPARTPQPTSSSTLNGAAGERTAIPPAFNSTITRPPRTFWIGIGLGTGLGVLLLLGLSLQNSDSAPVHEVKPAPRETTGETEAEPAVPAVVEQATKRKKPTLEKAAKRTAGNGEPAEAPSKTGNSVPTPAANNPTADSSGSASGSASGSNESPPNQPAAHPRRNSQVGSRRDETSASASGDGSEQARPDAVRQPPSVTSPAAVQQTGPSAAAGATKTAAAERDSAPTPGPLVRPPAASTLPRPVTSKAAAPAVQAPTVPPTQQAPVIKESITDDRLGF